jgi:uncharacterized protein YggE
MQQPDTITIEVVEADQINADRVDLFVTIKGTSLFTGQEALKKAREVHELVEGLTGFGLLEEDILLQNIQSNVSTGFIGQHSSATYRLRIVCRELDQLADIIGIITSQKNTNLSRMAWKYSDFEDFKTQLLEKCLTQSKEKAERVAKSLGVDLLGVHDFKEEMYDSEIGPLHQPVAARPRAASMTRVSMKEELGLSVSHAKRITLKVTTKYRVGPLNTIVEEK